jgi:release factor glutamine methyltransferase
MLAHGPFGEAQAHPMTIAAALRAAATTLAATSDTARLDAELLMAHALGVSRSDLLLRHGGDGVPESFAALIARRAADEPVAYILGHQEFYGLNFIVTPQVLIPRGDSEVLVDMALKARPDARNVLDCGTGSGALLLAVLSQLSGASGVGIDRSLGALAVAAANAAHLGAAARMVRGDWHEAGWSDGLGAPFDLILANPPYVAADAALMPSVRDYEPAEALFAGVAGLDDYRVLLPQLPALLGPGGVALIEIGADQADAVTAIATGAGFDVTLHHDLANRPRALEIKFPLGNLAAKA